MLLNIKKRKKKISFKKKKEKKKKKHHLVQASPYAAKGKLVVEIWTQILNLPKGTAGV